MYLGLKKLHCLAIANIVDTQEEISFSEYHFAIRIIARIGVNNYSILVNFCIQIPVLPKKDVMRLY